MTKIIANARTTTRPFNDWSSSTLISLNLLIWFVIVSIRSIMLGLLPAGSRIYSRVTSKLNETLDRLRSCLGSCRRLEQSKVCWHFHSLLSAWIFIGIGGTVILSSLFVELQSWSLFPPSISTTCYLPPSISTHLLPLPCTLLHTVLCGGCYISTQLHNTHSASHLEMQSSSIICHVWRWIQSKLIYNLPWPILLLYST